MNLSRNLNDQNSLPILNRAVCCYVWAGIKQSLWSFSCRTWLPRVSDVVALLFLSHMVSKMEKSGRRIAIIFNGSPLFTGDASSGESNIRKWERGKMERNSEKILGKEKF